MRAECLSITPGGQPGIPGEPGARSNSVSTTGTIADVAAFFRVTERTVREWKAGGEISGWKSGKLVCFGEESVIALRVKHTLTASKTTAAELREIARREWREHLGLRRADQLGAELAALRKEVETLKARPVADFTIA